MEILKRQFDLLALKIGLVLQGETPRVSCVLEGAVDGELEVLGSWQCTTEEMGLPECLLDKRVSRKLGVTCPKSHINALRSVLEEQRQDDQVLWLQLQPPFGYLNLVSWEQLLRPVIKCPIVRLPHFLVAPPPRNSNPVNVVLCASVPEAKGGIDVQRHFTQLITRLREALPGRLRFQVFVDQALYESLASSWAQTAEQKDIVLHDPQQAKGLNENGSRSIRSNIRLQNPWLLWMRDALQGQSIDTVHWLAHGYLSREQGALALAETPQRNADKHTARFVAAPEIKSFLTQIGAWSTVFSSPPNNFSNLGLRLLADTLAHDRPGPVVFQELAIDEDSEDLVDAYHFIHAPELVAAPVSEALTLYCHPSLVVGIHADTDKRPDEPVSRSVLGMAGGRNVPINDAGKSAVFDLSFPYTAQQYSGSRSAGLETSESDAELASRERKERLEPGWVSASRRYFDQSQMDLQRQSSARQGISKDAPVDHSDAQANRQMTQAEEDILRKMQSIIEKAAIASNREKLP